MKKFIKKSAFFGLCLGLYFTVSFLMNFFLLNFGESFVKKTRVIIMGDSHLQKGLNPEFFEDAQSLALTAEPYVATFWKLKKVLKIYKPDTLLLGFSHHSISEFNDYKFSDEIWSSEMFRRYYPIQEFHKIENEIEVNTEHYRQVYLKNMVFYPQLNHMEYKGGFMNKIKSDVSDWDKAIQRHFFFNERPMGVSKFSINYLDSIVTLCNEHNIELVLIGSPVVKEYRKQVPEKFNRTYLELIEKYRNEKILVLDKTTEEYSDPLFYNSDHLNGYGAEKFTKEIIEFIKKN